MYLNTLSPAKGSKKNIKRLGRGVGSGFGKTCARGHKGQKSRSGGKLRRGFEGGQVPLYRRLPKFGFNSNKKIFIAEVNLSDLMKIKEEIINLNSLKTAKIIGKKINCVKIISSGKITKSITVHGLLVTKGASIAIKSAGGKIE